MKIVPSSYGGGEHCCGRIDTKQMCKDCPTYWARESGIAFLRPQPLWSTQVRISLAILMAKYDVFNTDDVWVNLGERGIEDPEQPSAMGPIIRGYLHRGELILLDRVPSMRARRHNGTMGIYQVVR